MSEHKSDSNPRILATVGIVASGLLSILVALTIGRPVYVLAGLLVGGSCLIWYFFCGRMDIDDSVPKSSRTRRLILDLAFVGLLLLSIVIYLTRSETYVRPSSYFVFLSVIAGLLSYEIAFSMTYGPRVALTLAKIIAFGLSLTFFQSLVFPSPIGVDPWWHQMFTLQIIESGQIPGGYPYSAMPVFHVEVASLGILTDVEYKASVLLSVSVFQVVFCVLSVYLLGSALFSQRVGAMAALLLVSSSYFINMGFWTIPNTLGTALVPFLLYLAIRSGKSGSFSIRAIMILCILMWVLIMTHTIAAAGLAVCLFVGWLSYHAYSRIHHVRLADPNRFRIAVLFVVGMIGWWTYASGSYSTLVFLIRTGFRREPFQIAPTEVIGYASTVPDIEQVLGWLGLLLFFSISLIGCFYMISGKGSTRYRYSVAVISLILLTVPFMSMITGHRIYEHRFWYLALTILCIPLSLSLFMFLGMLRKRVFRDILPPVLVTVIVFLMIMSPTANVDNSQFTPNSTVRLALTDSELEAMRAIGSIGGSVSTDFYYAVALKWSGILVQSMDDEILNADFSEADGTIILLRSQIVVEPFWLYGTTWRLDYDPQVVLAGQSFTRFYDCGTVMGYVRADSSGLP